MFYCGAMRRLRAPSWRGQARLRQMACPMTKAMAMELRPRSGVGMLPDKTNSLSRQVRVLTGPFTSIAASPAQSVDTDSRVVRGVPLFEDVCRTERGRRSPVFREAWPSARCRIASSSAGCAETGPCMALSREVEHRVAAGQSRARRWSFAGSVQPAIRQ